MEEVSGRGGLASKIQLETLLDLARECIQQKKSKNQHHQDKLTKKNSEQNVKMQNKIVKNVGRFNRPYTPDRQRESGIYHRSQC